MNNIMDQLEQQFKTIAERLDAAGVEVAEPATADEYVTIMLPHINTKELNTMVRIVNPEAKLTGKGITAESKFRIVLDYVHAAFENEEAAATKQQEEETVEQQPVQPTAEEIKAAQDAAEQKRRIEATVSFINTKMGAEVVTVSTPVDVLKNMATALKAQQPTFTQQQLEAAVQSGFQAGVDEATTRIEEVPTVQETKPTVDLGQVYDALKTKGSELLKQATDAATAGNLKLHAEIMQKYQEVMDKVGQLATKHKDAIFTPERSKKILDNARASLANGLRQGAEVTDKYGHMGVDGLVNVANQVLNGVVQIAQTAINVTGTVGHATVDLTSGTINAAADLVEPKKN